MKTRTTKACVLIVWLMSCGCVKLNRRALHENAKTFAKEVCAGSAVDLVRERYAPEVVIGARLVACRGELAADGKVSSFRELMLLVIDGNDYLYVPSWGMLHFDSGRWLVVWQCEREFPSAVSFSQDVEACMEEVGGVVVRKRKE